MIRASATGDSSKVLSHSQLPQRDHSGGGNMAMGGNGVEMVEMQDPASQHQHHSWQPQSRQPPHGGDYPPTHPSYHNAYHRQSPLMMQQHGHGMMQQHGHPDGGGYPPYGQPPMGYHPPSYPPQQQQQVPYYAGHPGGHHPMNQHGQQYYNSYGGPMEYENGGNYSSYPHHPGAYPSHYGEGSYGGMAPDASLSHHMYATEGPARNLFQQAIPAYHSDSRHSIGHRVPDNNMRGGDDRRYSFPTHVGIRSIADDSKTPSPPPGIPPPPGTTQHHELSAPISLDETDGSAGPLRQSGLSNRSSMGGFTTLPQDMGSSEKRETLDTASVLLAFSSAKKSRPASTTSTLDDTDALSLATMSTLPNSIAPAPDHSVSFPPPTEYPQRLAMPEDKDRLNHLHCYMRSELLELVVIQPAETDHRETDSFSKTPTSTDLQQIGRVGLRCVHCSMSADGGRSGPSMSIFYPKSLGEIYRLVTSWKRCHLSKCKNIPKSIREELQRLDENKARGKTSYWMESAARLGLLNMPTKIGGICFSATAENVVYRSESLTPAKLSATTQSTVTADSSHSHSNSPESLPTISDASTLGRMNKIVITHGDASPTLDESAAAVEATKSLDNHTV